MRILSFIAAAFLASTARAQPALSDSNRLALYCMGALQAATETLLALYPNACATGAERGCAAMREVVLAIEDGRTLTRHYLATRFADRRGLTGQLLLAIRIGEEDQKRCLRWRIERHGSSPAGGLPAYCRKVDTCRDVGWLSGILGVDPR